MPSMQLVYTWGSHGKAYYTRGHVDIDLFLRAVNAQHSGEFIPKVEPRHTYLQINASEDGALLLECDSTVEGAHPVTYLPV